MRRVTMTRLWRALSLAALVGTGCADSAGPSTSRYDQPEVPGYASSSLCRSGASSVEAAFTARTQLGFSGRDLIDAFNANAHSMLTWQDDQSSTELELMIVRTPEVVESDDFPTNEDFCAPALRVHDVTLTARTLDGRLDERFEAASLVGVSDGRGGIAGFFVMNAVMEPSELRGSVPVPPALVREGDVATLSIDLSWNGDGTYRAYCYDGALVSDDPSDACSAYPGRIRYTSAPASYYEDPAPDLSAYIDVALARIEHR